MRRCPGGHLLLLAGLALLGGCTARETATPGTNTELAQRIERLVETFLTTEDDDREGAALSEAKRIYEREGIPTLAEVGDSAAYGFVFVNMFGQPQEFQVKFLEGVRDASTRQELPEDAVALAEARFRQTSAEERYKTHLPTEPALRDQISRLFKGDQAVREREGFDARKMEEADQRTAGPLKTIFDQYGVPTYEMVGAEAAKEFAVMVQHQPAEFRRAVLPKLKANVDAGQADPATYATVYDRSQRDQGKNQLYGEQLECTSGKALEEAPIDDEAHVNLRRAQLGLMRVEIYARLVRLSSPDLCGAVPSKE